MSPTASRTARTGRSQFLSGPWKRVLTTTDPFDDAPDTLIDQRNRYIPDPKGGSGTYARPGFAPLNGGEPIYTTTDPFTGQAIYSHPMLDGSTVNFLVIGGHLFRVDQTLSVFTDVTPVDVTIDGSVTTRVFFASIIGQLVVTDGVNRPWIGSDLTSTPITGTYIDYDGAGGSWTAYGAPAFYGGSIFFILNQVNSVSRRTDIAWCEPGQPDIGYQQTDYDNNWTLETSSAGVLYALQGTNTALYYWRELSIGAVTGTVGPDLASTATEDAISFNVGSQAAQTIQQFGNAFYFCDAIGRPWLFQPGNPPTPIWYQMRAIVDRSQIAFPTVTRVVATSVLEPTLNLFLVAIWSPSPGVQATPTEMYCFDANSGTYLGRWDVANNTPIECVGTVADAAGRVMMLVLTEGGYAWSFNSLAAIPEFLATNDGDILATNDGTMLTTNGQPAVWTDGDVEPNRLVTTGRFNYAADTVLTVDRATVITLSDTPVRVEIQTASTANSVEGIPSPSASQDDTCRLVCGCDIQGRGPQVTVTPLGSDTQHVVQQIALVAVPSSATEWDA